MDSKQVLENGVTTAWGKLNYAFLNAGKFSPTYLVVLLAFPFSYSLERVLGPRMTKVREKTPREQINFALCGRLHHAFRHVDITCLIPLSIFWSNQKSYWLPLRSLNKLLGKFSSFNIRFFFTSFFVFMWLDWYQSEEVHKFVWMTRGSDNSRLNAIFHRDIYSRHFSTSDKPPNIRHFLTNGRIMTNLKPPKCIIPRWTFIAVSLSLIIVFS